MVSKSEILYFDRDCPLEAVVSLAEPKDVPGLNEAFSSILKEHIPDRAIKVYEIVSGFSKPTADTQQLELSLKLVLRTKGKNAAIRLEINDEDVQKCLSEKISVVGQSATNGLSRTIIPIPGLPTPLGLLVIEGLVDESCQNFLDPLLRIY